MDQVELTAEQEAQAARIADVIVSAMRADAMARFMASRQDSELLGESEFYIRGSMPCSRSPSDRRRSLGAEKKRVPRIEPGLPALQERREVPRGAEQVPDRLAALRVVTSTVQRTTEAVGAQIAKLQRGGAIFQDRATAWEWSRDARGQSVAYISVDSTSVPQQGIHRGKAGRPDAQRGGDLQSSAAEAEGPPTTGRSVRKSVATLAVGAMGTCSIDGRHFQLTRRPECGPMNPSLRYGRKVLRHTQDIIDPFPTGRPFHD